MSASDEKALELAKWINEECDQDTGGTFCDEQWLADKILEVARLKDEEWRLAVGFVLGGVNADLSLSPRECMEDALEMREGKRGGK